jgi:hypothetical protein
MSGDDTAFIVSGLQMGQSCTFVGSQASSVLAAVAAVTITEKIRPTTNANTRGSGHLRGLRPFLAATLPK